MNGFYKTELIRQQGPWPTVDQLELATLNWVGGGTTPGSMVLHYPPGTSKWNRIEHRLFSHISINWRAKPLTSYQIMIDLITATTTSTGLDVYARLNDRTYQTSIKVSDQQLAAVNIERDTFHDESNYTITPSVE